MNELRFTYKLNITKYILRILFFAACAIGFGYMAHYAEGDVIANELSVNGESILYWCLAIASMIVAGLCISGLFVSVDYQDLTSKREVVLTGTTISSPESVTSHRIVTINYSDIIDLNIQIIQRQRFLNIFYEDSKLTISQNELSDKKAFEQLTNFVRKKVTAMPIKHFKNSASHEMQLSV